MSRKPRAFEAVHPAHAGPGVAARVGLYALGHVAKRPEWQCVSGLYVRHSFYDGDFWLRPNVLTGIGELPEGATPVGTLKQFVRCRKCDGCRSYRRAMWAARAISEASAASERGKRTWFVTLTHRIRPDKGGDDIFAREVTLALKRLRKLAAFRYMVVFERHKPRLGSVAGYPHAHGLIHEVDRIVYNDFKMVFARIGFFNAKLIQGDPCKAAGYCVKYLTKGDNPKRVRASFRYGGDALQGQGQPDQSTVEAVSLRDSLTLGKANRDAEEAASCGLEALDRREAERLESERF